MAKTICQSVAWFKRYKTLKSVPVGLGWVGSVGSVGSVGRVAQAEKIIIFSENSLGLARKNRFGRTYIPITRAQIFFFLYLF